MFHRSARTLGLVLTGLIVATTPAFADDHAAPPSVRVVATITPGGIGTFAESMASDGERALLVSTTQIGAETSPGVYDSNFGEILSVPTKGGEPVVLQRVDLTPAAMFMGITVADHMPYVTVYNFSGDSTADWQSGVLRVTRSGLERVMTLPNDTFPNGIAVFDDAIYVTDSARGAIWRGSTRSASTPTEPWLSSPLLKADDPSLYIGADGIIYDRDGLLVTNWANGQILRVPFQRKGAASAPIVVVQDPRLVRADGFVSTGSDLIVAVNGEADGGALVRVSKSGQVQPIELPAGSLDYPTQPVVTQGRLFVVNGAYNTGTPSVIEVQFGQGRDH